MPVLVFNGVSPKGHQALFLAPTAWAIGDVELGADVSLFFGVVLRGDILPIVVGSRTNFQENSLVHTSTGQTPALIGSNVTVGHGAIVHGAAVHDCCIIGMGSTILDRAVIEQDCIIGAQSLVPQGMTIPAGSMALGVPARVVRKLRPEEIQGIRESADHYVELARKYGADDKSKN